MGLTSLGRTDAIYRVSASSIGDEIYPVSASSKGDAAYHIPPLHLKKRDAINRVFTTAYLTTHVSRLTLLHRSPNTGNVSPLRAWMIFMFSMLQTCRLFRLRSIHRLRSFIIVYQSKNTDYRKPITERSYRRDLSRLFI